MIRKGDAGKRPKVQNRTSTEISICSLRRKLWYSAKCASGGRRRNLRCFNYQGTNPNPNKYLLSPMSTTSNASEALQSHSNRNINIYLHCYGSLCHSPEVLLMILLIWLFCAMHKKKLTSKLKTLKIWYPQKAGF